MSIPLYLLTFNCAKTPPFTHHQPNNINISNTFLENISSSFPKTVPKLFIFGFEELIPILPSLIPSNSSVLDELSTELIKVIQTHYADDDDGLKIVTSYKIQLGAIALIVLTSLDPSKIKHSSSSASCGILYSSLKGGVGLRLSITKSQFTDEQEDEDDDVEFTFINAHLSANEGFKTKRNEDFWKLVSSMYFGDGFSVLKPNNHTFFMGDLNYRALKYVNDEGEGEGDSFLKNDELSQVINDNEAFIGFKEFDINFKQTYKFHVGTNDYNFKRIPSWCDRILFHKYDNLDPSEIIYDSLPQVLQSDHKPVFLSLSIPINPPNQLSRTSYINSNGEQFPISPHSFIKYQNYLRLVVDSIIALGLFAFTTNHGRIGSGIASLAFLIYLYS